MSNLVKSWNQWTTGINATYIFLGLPAGRTGRGGEWVHTGEEPRVAGALKGCRHALVHVLQ
jgi:hypothetical protein